MFNLKSLIFTILKADLGETIMISLNKILNEVDNIVEVDLAKIN